MFKIIGKLDNFSGAKITLHVAEREKRLEQYKYLMNTNFIDKFEVDAEHVNGNEVHCINSNGLIYIYNKRTRRLITILHPRPAQLKRYYRGNKIPFQIEILMDLCFKRNKALNFNKK